MGNGSTNTGGAPPPQFLYTLDGRSTPDMTPYLGRLAHADMLPFHEPWYTVVRWDPSVHIQSDGNINNYNNIIHNNNHMVVLRDMHHAVGLQVRLLLNMIET